VGLAGVTVSLYRTDGTLVASRTTDGNGDYTFTGVAPARTPCARGQRPATTTGRTTSGG
jgi:protocatechuate 3,4-dioxygenase beta subunit